jgi:hypothetical protein
MPDTLPVIKQLDLRLAGIAVEAIRIRRERPDRLRRGL